jgi:tetratricopeptide (TPR) repeat protein
LRRGRPFGLEAELEMADYLSPASGRDMISLDTFKELEKWMNAHDSLGEEYMIMGDKEKAIKYYKLAVELNPGDTPYAKRILKNSKDRLRRLEVEK